MENISVGNRGGIPFVNLTLSTAGSASTSATYKLPDHTFRWLGNVGMLVGNVATASGTVTGINISVNGSTLAMTDTTGSAITSLPVSNIIMLFNKSANTLQAVI